MLSCGGEAAAVAEEPAGGWGVLGRADPPQSCSGFFLPSLPASFSSVCLETRFVLFNIFLVKKNNTYMFIVENTENIFKSEDIECKLSLKK